MYSEHFVKECTLDIYEKKVFLFVCLDTICSYLAMLRSTMYMQEMNKSIFEFE